MATQAWPTELPQAPATMADYRALTKWHAADFAAWRDLDEAALRAKLRWVMGLLAEKRAEVERAEQGRPAYAKHTRWAWAEQARADARTTEATASMLRMMINLRHAGRPVN